MSRLRCLLWLLTLRIIYLCIRFYIYSSNGDANMNVTNEELSLLHRLLSNVVLND